MTGYRVPKTLLPQHSTMAPANERYFIVLILHAVSIRRIHKVVHTLHRTAYCPVPSFFMSLFFFPLCLFFFFLIFDSFPSSILFLSRANTAANGRTLQRQSGQLTSRKKVGKGHRRGQTSQPPSWLGRTDEHREDPPILPSCPTAIFIVPHEGESDVLHG